MAMIGYLVHDTTDAAVARRVRMFRAAGAAVRLGGFRRRAPPDTVAGVTAVDLGETRDARLLARLAVVLRHVAAPARVGEIVAGADVIVARNLEMLAIAVRVARPRQRIVYECLDIHRLLLSDGAAARALQAIERRLLARVDMVLTSTPAFRDRYFRARRGFTRPIWLEENRLLQIDTPAPTPACPATPAGRPWRIGWFGMLRCRRSLAILAAIARAHPDLVEVTIAGIPAYTEFDDFDRDVAATPGLRFVGRYGAGDLPALYGSVDFAWAIDFFEEGQNSAWLLPNRLYESLAFSAVPIALAGLDTGRWCADHGVGMLLDDLDTDLAPTLATLTSTKLARLRDAVTALPRRLVVADAADCRALTNAVLGTGTST
ncbi:succinoglycan biosynthesis protein ExoL [Sphingomonas guangdongensis]|uniref:Succinoglycan biosynthesis protein ExoL n=1 Tax=Sphingomonas guangdongensis TaxID=1141890 RepID=A0A285QHX0_9SPHN|nr:hypothetical protein [Sphingomonas guangdongensis]SOB81108.1 succinoglycan biosynthesis protein ExoL [Sphingomonas guangdongensis]